MNEQKISKTVRYFAERTAQCKALAQQLAADDRADEAVFEKIRMNVYDIFSTIFSVAIKNAGQEDEQTVQFFLTRLQQIPGSWQTALALAEAHCETEKAHIERIKLETVAEIRKEFTQIWEGTA